MARIYRDAYGVPHVRAASLHDLARGQGEVTARDRAWQLEYLRRRASGTTAEILGRGALPWDLLARRTGLAGLARRATDRLQPETRAFLAAYVEGVNDGLHGDAPELEALGIEPMPWEPWMPAAVFLAQHLLFGSLPGKLWLHRAREVLGDDATLLSPEGPPSSGSNAWAVGGARTATGAPLVGGDPHRIVEAPGVYQQVRLACEDPDDPCDVVGFAFPGVPGIQHFGHAGAVAWAITNALADYQDVYDERLRRTRDGGVEALGPGGWERAQAWREAVEVRGGAPVEVEVVVTARGPVFEGSTDEGRGLSLRTAAAVLVDAGLETLVPLLRARSVEDVDRALDHWVEPVNNVVVADRAGAVRYRIAGRVPVRARANRLGIADAADPNAGWRGWVDPLPRHDVDLDGQVVTANERRGPESTAIGEVFAPPHRAARIGSLLDGRSGLAADDFAAVHADTLLPTIDVVRDLLADAPAGAVRDAILAWDGRMDAGSAGAAAFAAWRSALARRVAAAPTLAPLREPSGHNPVFAPWLDLPGRVGLAWERLATASAADTPFGLDVRALAAQALIDAAGHPQTWGETHVLAPMHAFELSGSDLDPPRLPAPAVSGDVDCVRCTGSVPGVSDECRRGSVARYVWDLADRDASRWVVPLGAAGDPRSPHHHDQLPLWVEATLAPVVTDWEQLSEEVQ